MAGLYHGSSMGTAFPLSGLSAGVDTGTDTLTSGNGNDSPPQVDTVLQSGGSVLGHAKAAVSAGYGMLQGPPTNHPMLWAFGFIALGYFVLALAAYFDADAGE